MCETGKSSLTGNGRLGERSLRYLTILLPCFPLNCFILKRLSLGTYGMIEAKKSCVSNQVILYNLTIGDHFSLLTHFIKIMVQTSFPYHAKLYHFFALMDSVLANCEPKMQLMMLVTLMSFILRTCWWSFS